MPRSLKKKKNPFCAFTLIAVYIGTFYTYDFFREKTAKLLKLNKGTFLSIFVTLIGNNTLIYFMM